jgi:hypothetical protein
LERPIFFSPGAFDDEDYLDERYLQLDGMVYKLVPVKQLFLKMVVH